MNLNQVTLPVKDMDAATSFYRKLGFLQIFISSMKIWMIGSVNLSTKEWTLNRCQQIWDIFGAKLYSMIRRAIKLNCIMQVRIVWILRGELSAGLNNHLDKIFPSPYYVGATQRYTDSKTSVLRTDLSNSSLQHSDFAMPRCKMLILIRSTLAVVISVV